LHLLGSNLEFQGIDATSFPIEPGLPGAQIFETLSFVQLVLQLSSPVQEQLRTWLSQHLNQIQKRE
jgi:hypothetical protein